MFVHVHVLQTSRFAPIVVSFSCEGIFDEGIERSATPVAAEIKSVGGSPLRQYNKVAKSFHSCHDCTIVGSATLFRKKFYNEFNGWSEFDILEKASF